MADLGQVMKRMAQLIETLVSSVPQPAVVCPTHRSPAHHTYLSHPNHPPSYASPSSCQTASIWTDTPVSLPSSPITIPQHHVLISPVDSLMHRPQDLQMGYSVIPSSTPPSTPDSSQAELRPHLPLSALNLPEISHVIDGASRSTRSRVHTSPPQDGGDEAPHQSSDCTPQTGLGEPHHSPDQGL